MKSETFGKSYSYPEESQYKALPLFEVDEQKLPQERPETSSPIHAVHLRMYLLRTKHMIFRARAY